MAIWQISPSDIGNQAQRNFTISFMASPLGRKTRNHFDTLNHDVFS
jgi:hypothetical protein